MSKAHEMKAGLGHLPFLPNAGHRKRMPEHDPENHEIMRLRVEERMGWADIAEALNEDRISQGKVSDHLLSSLTLLSVIHPSLGTLPNALIGG